MKTRHTLECGDCGTVFKTDRLSLMQAVTAGVNTAPCPSCGSHERSVLDWVHIGRPLETIRADIEKAKAELLEAQQQLGQPAEDTTDHWELRRRAFSVEFYEKELAEALKSGEQLPFDF